MSNRAHRRCPVCGVVECGGHATGSRAATPALAPKQRVRHRKYPHLEGRIDGYEYHQSGAISPIPYRIRWDSDRHAADVLGWFFIYGSDDTVEAIP